MQKEEVDSQQLVISELDGHWAGKKLSETDAAEFGNYDIVNIIYLEHKYENVITATPVRNDAYNKPSDGRKRIRTSLNPTSINPAPVNVSEKMDKLCKTINGLAAYAEVIGETREARINPTVQELRKDYAREIRDLKRRVIQRQASNKLKVQITSWHSRPKSKEEGKSQRKRSESAEELASALDLSENKRAKMGE
jgi:hypothetical protein